MEQVEFIVSISNVMFFVAQPTALANGLAQIWTNQNRGIPPGILSIQLQNQMQYICSGG